jgi:hypothetical protein
MNDLAARIAQLEATVARLADLVHDQVEEQRFVTRMALAPLDRSHLATLLPAAWEVLGAGEWTAADLYAEALLDSSPARGALKALVGAYETPEGGLRSLGGFLDRCAGRTSGGLRLVALGRTRDGVLYAVKRLSTRAKHASPVAPEG